MTGRLTDQRLGTPTLMMQHLARDLSVEAPR